jgi:hypothetical protein
MNNFKKLFVFVLAVALILPVMVLSGCGPSAQTQAIEHYNKGNALYDEGNYDGAIAEYNKAIELDPNYERAYYNRGLAYYKEELYDLAIADCNKAIELAPNNTKNWTLRGVILCQFDRYEEAMECFNKAIELDPSNETAQHNKDVLIAAGVPETGAGGEQVVTQGQGGGGSPFIGDWESLTPCVYYELSDEERCGKVTANFYLHIDYYDGFLTGSNWMEVVSRQFVPGADEFFVWSVLVPLEGKPGYYLGPLDFNTRSFPGEAPETTATISGDTLTVDTLVVGNYTQRIIFKLVNEDTLYVTLTFIRITDNWIFPKESDRDAIVLVRP